MVQVILTILDFLTVGSILALFHLAFIVFQYLRLDPAFQPVFV